MLERWELALDVLVPSLNRRRGRFDLASRQSGYEKRCQAMGIGLGQKSLARHLGTSLRVLNSFLNADQERPNALDDIQKHLLNLLLCGEPLHRRWLDHGICFDEEGDKLVPEWAVSDETIRQMEMATEATATVHAYMLMSKTWKYSRIVQFITTNFGWEIINDSAPFDSSSPPEMWMNVLRKSGLKCTYDVVALGGILKALDKAGFSVAALWRRFPERASSAWNGVVAGTWLGPAHTPIRKMLKPTKAATRSNKPRRAARR